MHIRLLKVDTGYLCFFCKITLCNHAPCEILLNMQDRTFITIHSQTKGYAAIPSILGLKLQHSQHSRTQAPAFPAFQDSSSSIPGILGLKLQHSQHSRTQALAFPAFQDSSSSMNVYVLHSISMSVNNGSGQSQQGFRIRNGKNDNNITNTFIKKQY